MTVNTSSKTFYWALTGIFGALHLVLTMIPLFVLTGGGGFISIGLVSSVVIGFLLGPIYGTLSVLLGSSLGVLIFDIGGILGPIIPVVAPVAGAVTAGCLKEERTQIVLVLYVLGLLAFFLSPIGLTATIYIWMHLIATGLVILLSVKKTKGWLDTRLTIRINEPEKSVLPIWLIVFIALLCDNLIGGALGAYWFVYALGALPGDLSVLFVGTSMIYPLERIAVSIVATAVILALIRALSGTQLSFLLEKMSNTSFLEHLDGDETS